MEQETDWVPVPLQNMYQGVLLQSTQSDPQDNLSGMRDPSFARSSPPSDHHSQQSWNISVARAPMPTITLLYCRQLQ